MEQITIGKKWRDGLNKYKYVLLVVAIGVLLMCIPGKKEETTIQVTEQDATQTIPMEDKLEQVLAQIQGAGRVKVMLTISEGERILYQYDSDMSGSNTERKDTVIITDGNRKEEAVIAQIIPPIYMGAIIVCQGADQAAVKYAIVEAVSKATGLGADKICVLKMK